jgi:hypothetical protein
VSVEEVVQDLLAREIRSEFAGIEEFLTFSEDAMSPKVSG